jgi:hypothetical protein
MARKRKPFKPGCNMPGKLKIGGTSGGADFLLERTGAGFKVPIRKAVWCKPDRNSGKTENAI